VLVALVHPVFSGWSSRGLAQSSRAPADLVRLSALLGDSRFTEAGDLAATLLRSGVNDPEVLAVCGLALLKSGRLHQSEQVLKRAISRAPRTPEAHLGLGRLARVRNQADVALGHLHRAVSSERFYEEASRALWRTAWEQGDLRLLGEVTALIEERFKDAGRPSPTWLSNSQAQIRGLTAGTLFRLDRPDERERIPLLTSPEQPRLRQVMARINGKGEYAFDIDSASADFMTVSPLLAEDLGLTTSGASVATGVGTGTAVVRFSRLDRIELGRVTFTDVPVMVSDLDVFRGLKKGLIGTALLKRFNVTIDVPAAVVDLFPLERPDLLRIDRAIVAADVPLYLFDATVVEARMGGAPPALYILDSAAAAHLVDRAFFNAHLRSSVDPARIARSAIRGAQGSQWVNRIDGLSIRLGLLEFPRQAVHEFSMDALNRIGGRYAAGLIGNPVLWPYRVHMNFREGRLVLEGVKAD
jgi:hypothetical protein